MHPTPAGLSTDDAGKTQQTFYYKLIRLFHLLLAGIRKNVILFIVCMLIGIVPLLLKNNADAGYYKASFTVAYDELFRKIYGDRLAKINILVNNKQYKKVAYILQITPNDAAMLVKVEGKNIIGEDLSKDLNTDRIPFTVNMVVKDSSKLMTLQNGIVNFLETGNEFLSDRKQMRIEENKEELAYINTQLRTMDSLNKKGVVGGGAPTVLPDGKKSSGSLFEFSYELYKRKQELLRKERVPASLLVVDDAIVSTDAQKPVIILVAVGIFLGFFLYLFLVVLFIPALRFKE